MCEQKVAHSKVLFHPWKNEYLCRYELCHYLAFTKSDTAGEVIFAGSSTLTHRVFEDLPNVNHAYLRLRQQYQKWPRARMSWREVHTATRYACGQKRGRHAVY